MKSAELTAAKRTAREFVDRFPFVDAGLLFVGDSGLGKTHLACAILAELISTKGVRGLYVDSSSLLNRIAASFRPDAEAPRESVLSPYMGAELLVLDEIGATPPHPWVTDVLYDLLNTRYNGKKTTIVTTNYRRGDRRHPPVRRISLEDRIGYRNLSRLYEMCLMVPLRGDDYRKIVLQGPDSVRVLRVSRRLARGASPPPSPSGSVARAARRGLPAPRGSPVPRRGAASHADLLRQRPAGAAPPVPVPADAAPSGMLLRIGLKSDLSEFVLAPPGQRWIVVSAARAEMLRGPLRFRPEGAAAGGFQVQAGAFAQEAPARERLEGLAARFGVAGTLAFSADRGVYRVLLGAFPDRASAEALAQTLRGSGEEAMVVEGRASTPPGRPPP